VMADECGDQILGLSPLRLHAGESFPAGALTASVGLFVRIQLRIFKEPVLEVIDAEFGRFFVCN
jgi:hypothetical protein